MTNKSVFPLIVTFALALGLLLAFVGAPRWLGFVLFLLVPAAYLGYSAWKRKGDSNGSGILWPLRVPPGRWSRGS
jgi:hypothetical protein